MEPNGGEDQKASLEKKANEFMQLSLDESEALMRIVIPVQRPGESTFYENFALRGIRVDRVEPGLIVCTFKVPPRLTDRAGNLANGAIANLVDVVGSYVTYTGGLIRNVSVDISISYMSTAKLDDEVEITSKRLGQKGGYTGIMVLLRNKATGSIIAEGRHSMFRLHTAPKL
ncbi:putative acyl-CoA hydrolase [Rosa chinensis]|uniref:Acyl-coenzyme A thioesterase 13 n=1 Tax=Rosa chinensis TaxID=74649 RepID=A0A2P6QJM1_ROSCH|nr:acyl-coenzyme A thioesterase 13 isoform X3 [Rosa chinensis]XP_040375525.1 acyl-coenzyme A thioesterase 13 isoform X3 [Rosa chinensis]XP_040375526.1 acyl-coenzyme A thioesterase 13 isoform X3 [Rosa chinensis]PRQ34385.1 putative acyl-CoA hydrolase [Rosa chinensis]